MKKSLIIVLSIFLSTTLFGFRIINGEQEEGLNEELELIDKTTLGNNSNMAKEDIFVTDLDPEDLTVELFKPLVLSFEVKEEGIKIIKYHWLIEGGSSDPYELKGTETDSNYLVIPSVAYQYGEDFYVECIIDYIDQNDENKEKSTYTNTKHIYVDGTIEQNISQVVNIGDFSIFPGKSLNLDTYNMGSGIISLNEAGDTLTLDNVNFKYNPETLKIDRIFTMNTGIAYYTYNNKFDEININLIGDNNISNLYRREASDEDGYAFAIYNVGTSSSQFNFNPNINFNGSGSLTTYGGLYGIYAAGTAVINTDININSSKYLDAKYPQMDNDTPARIGHGIYCVNAKFKENAKVNMDIAGVGVNATLCIKPGYGDVSIEEGADIYIKNNNYVRHPYESTMLPSKTAGISYNGDLDINGAKVKIDLIADKALFRLYETTHPEEVTYGHLYPYLAVGLYQNDKQTSSFELNIEDSDVEINIDVINCDPDEEEFYLVRGYGIDNSGYNAELDGSLLTISNSNVDIDMSNTGPIDTGFGIKINNANLLNSNINIDCSAFYETQGISTYEYAKGSDRESKLYVEDSDVTINAKDIDDETNSAYGVKCDKAEFKYTNYDNSFKVNGDDGTILSYIGDGNEERSFEEDYVPTKLSFAKNTIIENKLPISVTTLGKKLANLSLTSVKLLETPTGYYDKKAELDYEEETNLEGTLRRYYETIYDDGKVAKSAVIKYDKPRDHYIVPATGVR